MKMSSQRHNLWGVWKGVFPPSIVRVYLLNSCAVGGLTTYLDLKCKFVCNIYKKAVVLPPKL